jgi:hypothetical protein
MAVMNMFIYLVSISFRLGHFGSVVGIPHTGSVLCPSLLDLDPQGLPPGRGYSRQCLGRRPHQLHGNGYLRRRLNRTLRRLHGHDDFR